MALFTKFYPVLKQRESAFQAGKKIIQNKQMYKGKIVEPFNILTDKRKMKEIKPDK